MQSRSVANWNGLVICIAILIGIAVRRVQAAGRDEDGAGGSVRGRFAAEQREQHRLRQLTQTHINGSSGPGAAKRLYIYIGCAHNMVGQESSHQAGQDTTGMSVFDRAR